MKKIALALAACLIASAAFAQVPGPPNPVIQQFLYKNITTDATTTVKSGAGVVHSICINTVAATETVKVYDNTAGSGTLIGTITEASGQSPSCLRLDAVFNTGLTIVTATAAGDLTITYY